MAAAFASSDVFGCSMLKHSQIANVIASTEFRKSGNDQIICQSHIANMADDPDKNGGPNHLGAWMRYRDIKGIDLAKALDVTPGMVSDLMNSKRALSAKWLRRIAPHVKTTPGMLLDHDPHLLDSDIIEIWISASQDQRKTLANMARVVVPERGAVG